MAADYQMGDLYETVQEGKWTIEKLKTLSAMVYSDDNNNKHIVYTTLTQPLLTADGDFVEVGMLRIGTRLKHAGKVNAIVLSGERKVYDFQTTGGNRYYANGFIAHGAYSNEGV